MDEPTDDQTKKTLDAQALEILEKGPTPQDGEGVVYILRVRGQKDEPFKVGMTTGLKKRIATLKSQNKEEYELVGFWSVRWRKRCEQACHAAMEDRRLSHRLKGDKTKQNGGSEWFRGDEQAIIDIVDGVVRSANTIAAGKNKTHDRKTSAVTPSAPCSLMVQRTPRGWGKHGFKSCQMRLVFFLSSELFDFRP